MMNDQKMNEMVESGTAEIDLLNTLRLLWQKIWIILLCMAMCGALAFGGAYLTIEPQYTASAMMYANNNSLSVGGSTITFSSSQLSAAKSLLDVYVIILKSRTTLESAIDRADLPYSYDELRTIVSAGSVDNTEIFTITATCGNADHAQLIVETLVEILPDRISDIVDGSSVRVVDRAVRPVNPSSPSYTRYALIGTVLGALLSCALIVIQDLMNTTVRDEEYLKQRYNIPILAVVPDVYETTGKKYGYKYKYGYHHRYKYGYQRVGYYQSGYEQSMENAKTEDGDKQ